MIKRKDFLIKDEKKEVYIITDKNGKNGHSVLKTSAAVKTIYHDKNENDIVALKDIYGKVYLGKENNYFYTSINSDSEPIAFYDNSDNSLEFVSDKEEIFNILSDQNFKRMSDIQNDKFYDKEVLNEWENIKYKFNKFTKENINYDIESKKYLINDEEENEI